jgi:uncharacterized membrane protein YuzA (DUF378 family)
MDKLVCQLSTLLVLIGALNWGLVGAGSQKWNVVTKLTEALVKDDKTRETIERTVYILVGLAAVFLIYKKLASKRS